jgi:hypothetical protein
MALKITAPTKPGTKVKAAKRGVPGSRREASPAAPARRDEVSAPKSKWPGVTKKFGETVSAAGVTAVPMVLITGMADLRIKPIHLAVLLQLIAAWGPAGPHPFPSRARMRKQIGCDKRTLDKAIKELIGLGLVEKRKRPGRTGGWWTNEYDLSGLVARLAPLGRRAINRKRKKLEALRAAEAG